MGCLPEVQGEAPGGSTLSWSPAWGEEGAKESKGEEGVKENEAQREGMRGKVLGKKGSTVKMGGRHGGGYFNMEDFELLGWKSIVTN